MLYQIVKFAKDSTRRTDHKKYELVSSYNTLQAATDKLHELTEERKKNGIYLSNLYGIVTTDN